MVKTWQAEPTKRLIYDSHTGRYLTSAGKWTDEEEDAKNFHSVFQALEFCCENQIDDAELVFKFGENECQVSIPITDYPNGQELTVSQLLRAQELWDQS